jgi:hypothetical protein
VRFILVFPFGDVLSTFIPSTALLKRDTDLAGDKDSFKKSCQYLLSHQIG